MQRLSEKRKKGKESMTPQERGKDLKQANGKRIHALRQVARGDRATHSEKGEKRKGSGGPLVSY